MDRRIPRQPLIAAGVAAALLALAASAAEETPLAVLASYSFDDELVETGPDTFAVMQNGRGSVELSSAYRASGYHSVEIRDVPGDGDFPELQGYFRERRIGSVYAHFALLVTDPAETLNIALAGRKGFVLRKEGISVWLRTRNGWLEHITDGIPKKLLQPRAFAWYRVDLGYDVARGRYDLAIAEEGVPEAVVIRRNQPSATTHPGSLVDKFSFIGDTGRDDSSVVYYVDDVVIATDAAVTQRDFVAPGRRKLFYQLALDARARMDARPTCLPGATLDDFAIGSREARVLLAGPMGLAVRAALSSEAPVAPEPAAKPAAEADDPAAGLDADTPRRVMALRQWASGCRLLAEGQPSEALVVLESAASLAPEARRPRLAVLWALLALGRFDEVDARWSVLESEWRSHPLYPVVMARLGLARGDLAQAEEWLSRPAESLAGVLAGSSRAQRHLVEQYFYVLLWNRRAHDAERLALAAIAGLEDAGRSDADWIERAGDAAVALGDHSRGRERYEQALRENPNAPQLLLKLSDVHFLMGDADGERVLRERIYGSLLGRR